MIAPELEPVAGACLAINLAYLGLARFRYRKQIRDAALEQRRQFGRNDDEFPQNVKQLDHYAQLNALCGLPNHDYVKEAGEASDAKIKGTIRGAIYQIVYSRHFDRFLSYACAATAGFTLIAGVAGNLNATWFGLLPWVFHEATGGWWLLCLTISSATPIALVLLGRNIVHHISGHAEFCRKQIEISMQISTQTATIPASVNAAADRIAVMRRRRQTFGPDKEP